MAHLSGSDAKRSTDVLAKSDVKLIEIDPDVLKLASPNCRYQFSDAFLHMLVKRLTVANTRISRLLSDSNNEQ
jgi:CRP-like cAMP-binding protein